ncbi:MAG: DUF4364 family protein [Christensenellaceae bacterium]|jgi:hypothetical protein
METNQGKIAVQKITILYFLQKAQMRILEKRLIEATAELELMDYFDLQTNLHDMLENHLVLQQEAVNGKFFSITEVGETTLAFFEKEMLYSVRTKIETYCAENAREMRLESNLHAEYVRIAEAQYRVMLRMIENDVAVFEMTFFAASREEADQYVTAWRNKAMDVYRIMFETLLEEK